MTDSQAQGILNRLGLKHTPSLDDLKVVLRTTYDVSSGQSRVVEAALEEIKLDQIAHANKESVAMLARQSAAPAVPEIPTVTRAATVSSLTSAIQHLVAFPYASEADSYSVAPVVDLLRSTLRRFTSRDIDAASHQSSISLSAPAPAPSAAAPSRAAVAPTSSTHAQPERIVQSPGSSSTSNSVERNVENAAAATNVIVSDNNDEDEDDHDHDHDDLGDDERSDDDGERSRAEQQHQQERRAEASSSSRAVASNHQQHANKKRKLSTGPKSKPKRQRTVGHPGASRYETRTLAQPSKFVRRQTLKLLRTSHL